MNTSICTRFASFRQLGCLLPLAALGVSTPVIRAQLSPDQIVDLSPVPQLHETSEQRDARMQWFRDAKFGMFIHWGPCTVGDREIGWGRHANRPWDINQHGPRTTDPDYDNYFRRFNPVKYDADAWVRVAQAAGMKYMVLISKHHDGFAQFDSQLTGYDIMSTPYGKDIVKQFVGACHRHGMKAGLYYSTRDWFNPDYLVGDNATYDAWYRGQVEELLSHYGNTVYVQVFAWPGETLRLGALPEKILKARLLLTGAEVACNQTDGAVELTVPAAQRGQPVTVIELTLDQPVPRGQQVAGVNP